MDFSPEKSQKSQGNGLHFVDLLRSLGMQLLTALLPVLAARSVAWLEKKSQSSKTPDPPIQGVAEPEPHNAGSGVVNPPPLPPLTELPRGDS